MSNLVSIILPTYNGASRIKDAVESVLGQTYANWELLVVDDGSTDSTGEVIKNLAQKEPRIKYIINEINLGIQKSLNKGITEAKGEYIARIDDDDVWCEVDKLKKQVEFLENNKDFVLVGTGVIVVDESSKELYRYLLASSDQEIRSKILSKNCFAHSSVMFRKISAMRFGGYGEGEEARHMEDYDLWLKLGTVGKIANLRIYGIKFMRRENSLSSVNKLEIFKKNIALIRKYKHIYPNYYWALVRSLARLVIYGIFLKLPLKFSLNKITKIYKES